MSHRTEFTEAEFKYLEFIQGNIARMSNNSFLLKGWSVTLVAAILALSIRAPNVFFVLIALLPGLSFWGLDAFYLAVEKKFRDLHIEAVKGDAEVFDLASPGLQVGLADWGRGLVSRTTIWFHLAVVITVVAVALLGKVIAVE